MIGESFRKTSMKFFMALAIVSICLSKCGGSSGEKTAKHSTQSEAMRIKQKIAEMAGEDDDLDEEENSELLAGVDSGYATEESTAFSVASDSEYTTVKKKHQLLWLIMIQNILQTKNKILP